MRLAFLAVLTISCADPRAETSDAEYDQFRKPDALVAALRLDADDTVADVGAGTGYLTTRLAARARRVVATDVDAAALAMIPKRANIETRVVPPDEPSLEADRYDLILLAQVDQYLPDRQAYFARLRPSLAKDGRLAISNKLTFRARAAAAAEDAGYTLVEDVPGFPGQFLLIYSDRPAAPSERAQNP